MANKLNAEIKAAVSLIIREDLSVLKNITKKQMHKKKRIISTKK